MAFPDGHRQSDDSWVPGGICTLPTVEQPLRMAEFDALFSDALVGVERRGGTLLDLRLRGHKELPARVRSLADRENECCSFFTFTITSSRSDAGTDVRLRVCVPSQRGDVLGALADRAERCLRHEAPWGVASAEGGRP